MDHNTEMKCISCNKVIKKIESYDDGKCLNCAQAEPEQVATEEYDTEMIVFEPLSAPENTGTIEVKSGLMPWETEGDDTDKDGKLPNFAVVSGPTEETEGSQLETE